MRNLFLLFILILSTSANAQTLLRGVIQDMNTSQPVEGAKVSISNQGVGVISDEKGRFLYRKYDQVLDKDSALKISAPGYETLVLSIDKIRAMYNTSSKIGLTPGTSPQTTQEATVGVFWDASANMAGRDTEKELEFLSNKLKEKGTAQVQFYVFNNQILFKDKATIVNGDISRFRESLKKIKNAGPSNYSLLPTEGLGELYLFSNAQANFGFLDVNDGHPVHVVMSKRNGMNNDIKEVVDFTGGAFYNLTQGTAAVALDNISTTTNNNTIRGKVTSSGRPLQTATVAIKGSFDEFYTDASGAYELPAEPGDIIEVRYLGMYPKAALVEESNTIDFELIPENEQLAEVVISGKKRDEDNTITTGYGKENKDKIGYSVSEITSDQFNDGATSLRDLITGRFSSVTVSYNAYEGESYRIRGGSGSISDDVGPLWVVDGTPYQDVPVFLDVTTIQSISILKSLSATTRYGTLARGGAFVITTKFASRNGDAATDPQINTALAKGNDYAEQLLGEVNSGEHPYMQKLRAKTTPQEQYAYFNRLTTGRSVSLEFYADAIRHFQQADPSYADQVRTDLAYIARNNPKALRTLAYLYEEAGDVDNALLTYKRILKIAPQDAQSYRDVANALKDAGEYNKSLELYINMLAERVRGVNFSGMEDVLKTELAHLAKVYKDKIEFSRLPNEWLLPDFKQDIRMVIEWSDQSVPFEFQFVDPKKKFFKWKHTLEDEPDRLSQEKKQGFQIEEFIIDDAKPKGEWIVNVQYLGLPDDYILPPFLKYTIYRDYGTKNERKEVKLVKLFKQTDKVTLSRLLI